MSKHDDDQKQQIQKLQSMTVIQDSTLHQVDCQAKKKKSQQFNNKRM